MEHSTRRAYLLAILKKHLDLQFSFQVVRLVSSIIEHLSDALESFIYFWRNSSTAGDKVGKHVARVELVFGAVVVEPKEARVL